MYRGGRSKLEGQCANAWDCHPESTRYLRTSLINSAVRSSRRVPTIHCSHYRSTAAPTPPVCAALGELVPTIVPWLTSHNFCAAFKHYGYDILSPNQGVSQCKFNVSQANYSH